MVSPGEESPARFSLEPALQPCSSRGVAPVRLGAHLLLDGSCFPHRGAATGVHPREFGVPLAATLDGGPRACAAPRARGASRRADTTLRACLRMQRRGNRPGPPGHRAVSGWSERRARRAAGDRVFRDKGGRPGRHRRRRSRAPEARRAGCLRTQRLRDRLGPAGGSTTRRSGVSGRAGLPRPSLPVSGATRAQQRSGPCADPQGDVLSRNEKPQSPSHGIPRDRTARPRRRARSTAGGGSAPRGKTHGQQTVSRCGLGGAGAARTPRVITRRKPSRPREGS